MALAAVAAAVVAALAYTSYRTCSVRRIETSAQVYAKAKSAFESELGGPARVTLLESHGGAKWAEVKRLQKLGEVSANDPVAGADAYKKALAALPDALSKAAGEWQACRDRAGESPALEAGNAEATALKAEAERILKPTLTVESEVAGARVSDGRQTYDAPHTFVLRAGASYSFEVTRAAAGAVRYTPATFEITADWRGPKMRRVSLEELKGPQPGEVQTVDLGGGMKLELVWCPAGSFKMGSSVGGYDETRHRVTLTKGFWLGRTEVTQRQWEAVTGSNPSGFEGVDLPVETVSWEDCQAFVRKLNARVAGGGFRLPTEAEWEYACRAGTRTAYSFGSDAAQLFRYGNYCDRSNTGNFRWRDAEHDDGHDKTASVASFKPNAWGLYDMSGNVCEWCQDWYGGDYPAGSVTDPCCSVYGAVSGLELNPGRVFRGGSWNDSAWHCRSADRRNNGARSSNLGLRLARDSQ